MKKLFSFVSPPTFHLAPRSLDLIDLLYSSVNINVQPVEVLTAGQLGTFLHLMLGPTPTIYFQDYLPTGLVCSFTLNFVKQLTLLPSSSKSR